MSELWSFDAALNPIITHSIAHIQLINVFISVNTSAVDEAAEISSAFGLKGTFHAKQAVRALIQINATTIIIFFLIKYLAFYFIIVAAVAKIVSKLCSPFKIVSFFVLGLDMIKYGVSAIGS